MKSNIGKLFGVLVVGGSLITQTAGAQEEETCQLEVSKHTRLAGQLPTTEKTCIDDKTSEEILKIIENYKAETCQTPFCGCWLG